MRNRFLYSVVALSTLALAMFGMTLFVEAQSGSESPEGFSRTSSGRPDFSGFWSQPRHPDARGGGATVFTEEEMPPFQPGGEALFFEPRTGDPYHDEPRAFCLPSGFPSAFFGPYPVQIVQSEKWMVMVTEFQRTTRLIPLDGRPHLEGIEPTYYGDSVAHWEGDVLVIDTTNFKRWSLDDYYYVNPEEYRMHSDAFHTIERLQFLDSSTLSYEFTVDDPKIFTAPWTEQLEMQLHPEWEEVGLYEFVCEENNRCRGGDCSAQ